MIKAKKLCYTSFIGSSIALSCSIIEKGIPQATFSWRKGRHALEDGIYHNISIDVNSAMVIKLTNLTMENAGAYTCEATAKLSYGSDTVELFIDRSKTIFIM